ncbi:nuclear transport factor 2 family protein [Congregibacter sp.]|jgi:limonene-1,2-epoxide hydrolase|uniref:nuclear transport factor 2 family protein n=1 Tax=Congregibacter sp. TaxID=2744308 RepID=UPI0039E2E2D0
MATKIDSVRQLIACWERRDIDAVLNCLSDDIEYYWHISSRPVRGKKTMRKFLNNYSGNYEQKRWDIFNYAENGDLLLLEGHEELWDNEHQRTIQQPFMQAFEFRDGLISHWRDYYEPENLALPGSAKAEPQTGN